MRADATIEAMGWQAQGGAIWKIASQPYLMLTATMFAVWPSTVNATADFATPGQRRRQPNIALIQAYKLALRSGKQRFGVRHACSSAFRRQRGCKPPTVAPVEPQPPEGGTTNAKLFDPGFDRVGGFAVRRQRDG
jgi:hypothetical protein